MFKKLLIAISIISAAGLVVGAVMYSIFFWQSIKPQAVSLKDLKLSTESGFLAISPLRRENQTGLLLVRLSDGVEQFLAGNWQVNFTEHGNVYAFGYFPAGYSEQIGQQIYYIQPDRLTNISFSGVEGTITSIRENPLGTYMLIEETKDDNHRYCIAERIGLKVPSCTQINVPTGGVAVWNQTADHEIVVKNPGEEILLYDPVDPGFRKVATDDEQFATMNQLFAPDKLKGIDIAKTVPSFANLSEVSKNDSKKWVQVPWFSQTVFLNDAQHLLTITANDLQIVDLKNNLVSQLLHDDSFKKTTIQFYDYDQKVDKSITTT